MIIHGGLGWHYQYRIINRKKLLNIDIQKRILGGHLQPPMNTQIRKMKTNNDEYEVQCS